MSDVTESGSAADSPAPKTTGPYGALSDFVVKRVRELQSAYLRGEAGATASLARLRRAVGDEPGSNPVVWRETLGLPEQYTGRGDDPSRAERAVHFALTLFATHQQSQGQAMHRGGYGLGRAARQLGVSGAASEQAVLRRFQSLGTASSLTEAAVHARGLVTQFRSAGIPLDYGRLAVDFVRFQDPRHVASVRLNWGRDYYRAHRGPGSTENDDSESSEQSEGENS
ncbi:MAG TPA: type I-E CRISPR-associated protein Cse2/CasB [Terrimesophilobacter sp.]|nr:type I-E CRISPR-associated protein Cse2/CasB [Terrimesophilobacter sp.]